MNMSHSHKMKTPSMSQGSEQIKHYIYVLDVCVTTFLSTEELKIKIGQSEISEIKRMTPNNRYMFLFSNFKLKAMI